MTHVATLISAPEAQALDGAALAQAADVLPHAGAALWLAGGVAADLPFARPDTDLKAITARVQAALAGLPVDVVVQPVAHRRKRLILADMDSTMIGQECIDELAAEVGIKEHVAAITERAMRGELAFEPALRERVGLLKGVRADTVDRIIAERITLTPGGRTLIATMQANGAYTALVSGGFTVFTSRIAAMIGFDENRANHLDMVLVDGVEVLAGTVREPILGQDAKRVSLHELASRHGVPLEATLAVGDGANDLAMIRDAGLGVAFRAKPKVAAEADAAIVHGDLTALLYVQGYARDAFVAA
jgi:phosphoserine phosphatase